MLILLGTKKGREEALNQMETETDEEYTSSTQDFVFVSSGRPAQNAAVQKKKDSGGVNRSSSDDESHAETQGSSEWPNTEGKRATKAPRLGGCCDEAFAE